MNPLRAAAAAIGCTLVIASVPVWAQTPPKKDAGNTGVMPEEQFKALHELSTGAVPKLQGTMVDLAGGKAYLSLPADAKPPLPGIVVIQEWWGLNDHIKHWTDRLAAAGYAALAVDLYEGKVATTPDKALELMQAVDQTRATQVLLAGHEFLSKDKRVLAKKRGSIGWCFGGGQSLQLALAAPDLNACVMYYGKPVTDVAVLKTLKAPLLGIFANKDQAFPPSLVDEFDKALGAAGVKHRILRYDAEHAFANPSNPKYDQKAAAEAWATVQVFFADNLKK